MKRLSSFVFFLGVAIAMEACRDSPAAPTPPKGVTPASITVSSTTFASGAPIPVDFTCDGKDKSPQLTWSAMPATAKTIAIVVDDPDAPSGTFTHWIAWNLAPDTHALAEGAGAETASGTSGMNDFGRAGWSGPCPPKGKLHHYHFKVFGLDTSLTLGADAKRGALDTAMSGHMVAQGDLVGTFQH